MSQSPPPSPPGWIRALVLVLAVLVGVAWVIVHHPYEGPIVYRISVTHGVHQWDFLAVIPPLAALLWWSKRWW